MKIKALLATLLFAFTFTASAQEMTVNLDGVKISFVADMQNTKGTVSGFKAKIKFDVNDLTKSTITGTADVNTLDTGNDKRDEHLKSEDFFDASKYPTMSFKSKSFVKTTTGYTMTGTMKIKDVEREETITFTFANNMFKGAATIQASNYDLGSFVKKGPEKTNIKISFEIPVK